MIGCLCNSDSKSEAKLLPSNNLVHDVGGAGAEIELTREGATAPSLLIISEATDLLSPPPRPTLSESLGMLWL